MTHSSENEPGVDDPAGFRQLIVQLGVAMVAAGEAVDIIRRDLPGDVAKPDCDGLIFIRATASPGQLELLAGAVL